MIRTQVMQQSEFFLDAQMTGSRVICDPAPTDTDEDWIVLAKNHGYLTPLFVDGWEDCSPDGLYVDPEFNALRKGEVNLIVTIDYKFFCNFVEATHVAKELNLTDKMNRIFLFHYIQHRDFISAMAVKQEYKQKLEENSQDVAFAAVDNNEDFLL